MKAKRRRIAKLWKRSWIVTLPVALVFVLWLRGTYSRWDDFTVRHRTSQDLSLLSVGELEKDHLLRSAEMTATTWRTGEKLAATGLDTVHLYVKDGSLQRLNSNLPHSGLEYVEGGMYYDGAVHEVDVRYRGDNVYHWGFWKKSWRVKTKRGSLYKGMRKFNLVAPRTTEMLNNYFSYRLGETMGLISPYTEVVNVALNGEYIGVFVLTEQLEESTIRRYDRMPGDVYSGELVGMDSYQGIENKLFDHPGVWTKAAVNNHFDADAMTPLEELIRTIEEATDEEGQQRLSDLVDMEAFGRFSAFETLVCTVHIDALHNWRLYYDPWHTNFVPIVWDPVGWHRTMLWGPGGRGNERVDVIPSPFHAALFRNADFLRARARAFAEFFESGKDQVFLAEVRDLIERVGPAIDLDPNLVSEVEMVTPREVREAMAKLADGIEGVFEEVRQIQTVDPTGTMKCRVGSAGRLELEVQGRRPIEEIELRYSAPVKGPLVAKLRWENAGGVHEADVTGKMSVQGSRILLRSGLLARHQAAIVSMDPAQAHANGLIFKPARYDLVLEPRPGTFAAGEGPQKLLEALGGALVGVRYRRTGGDIWEAAPFSNAVTDEGVGRMELAVHADPGYPPMVISGEVALEGDRVVDSDVIIDAGTTFRMKPGANVLFLGRVFARGTAERPISFEPFEEGQEPWGVIAIKGEGSNGSEFHHCRFREGSGWKQALAEYSAMFSVHGVQDVHVVDCTFEDSRVVDDMVHGVYSFITFRRCTFRRSLADALDMDISSVIVEDCLFEESGNDSVDLMTTKAAVSDTRFIDAGDKGISVGEDSELVVLNSLMDGCLRGIEAKDKSVAIVLNSDFVNSVEIGVNAYNKNWRYDGGGTAYIYKSRFTGNAQSIVADRRSRIVVGDSSIDEIPAVKPRRITIEPTVDSAPGTTAADPRNERLPLLLKDPALFGRDLIRRMVPNRRGSTLVRKP